MTLKDDWKDGTYDMATHVFIPTRARTELLHKALLRWTQQTVEVHIVCGNAKKELVKYQKLAGTFNGIDVMPVLDRGKGIGWVRQQILYEADTMGLDAFVMSDDDYYPSKGRVHALTAAVLIADVIGCGASSSLHGLMLGNKLLKVGADFPLAAGFGHIMFGVNTANALSVDGFPEWATCLGEDDEIQRRGLAAGMPWWYTTHFRMTSMAPRYSPGGLADAYKGDKRRKEMARVQALCHEIWPEWVSAPPKPYRTQWKAMTDHYCPGWRKQVPRRVKAAGYGT